LDVSLLKCIGFHSIRECDMRIFTKLESKGNGQQVVFAKTTEADYWTQVAEISPWSEAERFATELENSEHRRSICISDARIMEMVKNDPTLVVRYPEIVTDDERRGYVAMTLDKPIAWDEPMPWILPLGRKRAAGIRHWPHEFAMFHRILQWIGKSMARFWLYVILAVIFVAALTIYGLDRGVYIGSSSFANQGIIYKKCRYLFITGISEIGAHGGLLDQFGSRGARLADWPDNLYCRFFAE
jgi:hypothetical protein